MSTILDFKINCPSRRSAWFFALLGSTLLVGNQASVAALLGKTAQVQSFRKMAEQSSDVDVAFLQPEDGGTSKR